MGMVMRIHICRRPPDDLPKSLCLCGDFVRHGFSIQPPGKRFQPEPPVGDKPFLITQSRRFPRHQWPMPAFCQNDMQPYVQVWRLCQQRQGSLKVIPGDDHQAGRRHRAVQMRMDDPFAGAAADAEVVGGDNK